MKITFENLCELIRSIVESEEMSSFYIGKTDNIEEREKDAKYEDYTLVSLVEGDSHEVSKLEEMLIEEFIGDKNCENEYSGSSGNPDACCIYLAYQEKTSNEDGDIDERWRKIYNTYGTLPLKIDCDEN